MTNFEKNVLVGTKSPMGINRDVPRLFPHGEIIETYLDYFPMGGEIIESGEIIEGWGNDRDNTVYKSDSRTVRATHRLECVISLALCRSF